MPVTSTHRDEAALTLTVVSEFPAPVDRVWQVWQDPRQLQRWWGPPGWPATVDRHEFTVGGAVRYHMTGPDGEKSYGWWTFTVIDPPTRLAFDDGFAGQDGEPLPTDTPTRAVVTLEKIDTGTRMTLVSHFASTEQLEQLVAMGMEEGLAAGIGQIDDLLTAAADGTTAG
ncbi:SRPBCC domain-containing protein [Micromonospora sp. NPDC000207]|uniref:SRPBCC family protein n=1 Tax=Micromonospora sp. NPDC000207 TaxID=3154246 RepID=UPI0033341B09